MGDVVRRNPKSSENIDTYANLLFKIGKVDEAIKMEEKALSLNPTSKDTLSALEKMKKGLQTW
jgi:hypothetical protein